MARDGVGSAYFSGSYGTRDHVMGTSPAGPAGTFPADATCLWDTGAIGQSTAVAGAPRGLLVSVSSGALEFLRSILNGSEGSGRKYLIGTVGERSPALVLAESGDEDRAKRGAKALVKEAPSREGVLKELRESLEREVLAHGPEAVSNGALIQAIIAVDSTESIGAKAYAMMPGLSFALTPIQPLRVCDTWLTRALLEGSDGTGKEGFLTMDQRRRVIPLDTQGTSGCGMPLVGAWIAGSPSPQDFAVWAACVKFFSLGNDNRRAMQSGKFLLALAEPDAGSFDFYEVEPKGAAKPGQPNFELLESQFELPSEGMEELRFRVGRDDAPSPKPAESVAVPKPIEPRPDALARMVRDKSSQSNRRNSHLDERPSSTCHTARESAEAAVNTNTDWPPSEDPGPGFASRGKSQRVQWPFHRVHRSFQESEVQVGADEDHEETGDDVMPADVTRRLEAIKSGELPQPTQSKPINGALEFDDDDDDDANGAVGEAASNCERQERALSFPPSGQGEEEDIEETMRRAREQLQALRASYNLQSTCLPDVREDGTSPPAEQANERSTAESQKEARTGGEPERFDGSAEAVQRKAEVPKNGASKNEGQENGSKPDVRKLLSQQSLEDDPSDDEEEQHLQAMALKFFSSQEDLERALASVDQGSHE